MSRIARLLTLSSLLLACGLVACGPGGRTRLGSERTETTVAAPAPSVAAYGAPSDGPLVRGGGDTDGVASAVDAAAAARSVTLTGDPRLAVLSEWIASQLGPGGEPPPSEVIDFFAWNLGVTDPTPHVIVHGLPDRASVEENVRASVERFLSRQAYTHWGAVVMPRNGLWIVVVTLSWRFGTLEPIERELPAGAPITLRGSLNEGFSNPLIVVESPSGDVQRMPAGSGPGFDVRVPVDTTGTFQLEVLARGPYGESIVANFPVYVGTEVPTSVSLTPEPETSGSTDVTAVRADLLRLLNETRREQGLPELTCDPRVDAIALAHSVDMHEHDFLGHQSPTTGTPADRVTAAGLHSGMVLENIGRDYTAAGIHRGLLASPGHHANLVSSGVNTCGIGVVADESDDRTSYIATEVFLRFAQAIDVAAAPAEVLAAINRAREARGAGALEAEENLRTAAQEAAEAFFTEPTLTQSDVVDRAGASMRRFAMLFRRVGGVMAVVSTLEEASTLEPTFEADLDYVGIGVAQGTRPDVGENAIAVVIMLGWRR
jgi:uncharacterized protein YkwD